MRPVPILLFCALSAVLGHGCEVNQCQHNGTCKAELGYNRFLCDCNDGFVGETCEIELLQISSSLIEHEFVLGDTNARISVKIIVGGSWGNIVNVTLLTEDDVSLSMFPESQSDDWKTRNYAHEFHKFSLKNSGRYMVVATELVNGEIYRQTYSLSVTAVELNFTVGGPRITASGQNFSLPITIGSTAPGDRVRLFHISDIAKCTYEILTSSDRGRYLAHVNATESTHVFVAFYTTSTYSYREERIVEIKGNCSNHTCESKNGCQNSSVNMYLCNCNGTIVTVQCSRGPVPIYYVPSTRDHVTLPLNATCRIPPTGPDDNDAGQFQIEDNDTYSDGTYTFFTIEGDSKYRKNYLKVVRFFIATPFEIIFVPIGANSATIRLGVYTNADLNEVDVTSNINSTVSTEETSGGLMYFFLVDGDFGSQEQIRLNASLRTASGTLTREAKVIIQEIEKSVTIIRGIGASISCGNGTKYWKKDGFRIAYSNWSAIYQSANGTLTFTPDVRDADGGTYVCEKVDGAKLGYQVNVEGKLEITAWSRNVPAMSERVELFCESLSLPRANITWRAQGYPNSVSAGNQSFEILDHMRARSTLVFKQALCLGRMTLSCQASNGVKGNISTKTFIVNPEKYGLIGAHYVIFSNVMISTAQNESSDAEIDILTLTRIAESLNIRNFTVHPEVFLTNHTSVEVTNSTCVKIAKIDENWEISGSECDAAHLTAVMVKASNAPTNLTASYGTCPSKSIVARWNATADAPHEVEIYTSTDNWSRLYRVGENLTTLTMEDLQPNTSYAIKVSSGHQWCRFKPYLEIAVRTAVPIPNAPLNPYMESNEGLECTLNWSYEGEGTETFVVQVYERIRHSGCSNITHLRTTSTEVSSRSNTHRFNMAANSVYSAVIQAIGCAGNSSQILASGNCRSNVSEPTSLKLTHNSGNSTFEATEGLTISLAPVNERNGPVSCVFVVVHTGELPENSSSLMTSREFENIKTSEEGEIEPGGSYFAFAVSGCELRSSTNVTIGDGKTTECNMKRAENLPRTKRDADTVISAHNRPLPAGTEFVYYIVSATPREDGTSLFRRSRSSEVYETITIPVTGIQISSEDSPLTNEITVIRGRRKVISCMAQGDPAPTIIWTQNGVEISTDAESSVSQTQSVAGRDLIFAARSRYDDQGSYVCIASNGIDGEYTQRKALNVTIEGIPELTEHNDETPGSDTQNFICVFEANPLPYVTWKIGGKQPSNDSMYTITVNSEGPWSVLSRLKIHKSALCWGKSEVTCTATNNRGATSRNIEMNQARYGVSQEFYILFPVESQTFTKALEHCQIREGSLIQLDDKQKSKEATNIAENFRISEFLLGARKTGTYWTWTDGTTVVDPVWGEDVIDETKNCVVLRAVNGLWKWYRVPCETPRQFACQVKSFALVGNLSAYSEECEGDSLLISWDGNSPITMANATALNGRSSNISKRGTKNDIGDYPIANLLPNTEYFLSITTVPEACRLRPHLIIKATTNSSRPISPDNVTIQPSSMTTCLLSWDYGARDTMYLSNFTIRILEEENSNHHNISHLTVTKTKNARNHSLKIRPNQKYTTKVSASSPCGRSDEITASGACVSYTKTDSSNHLIAIFLPIIGTLCVVIIVVLTRFYCTRRRRFRRSTSGTNEPSISMHRNTAYENDYIQDPTRKNKKSKRIKSSQNRTPKNSFEQEAATSDPDNPFEDKEYEEIADILTGPDTSDYITGQIFEDLEVFD